MRNWIAKRNGPRMMSETVSWGEEREGGPRLGLGDDPELKPGSE